MTLCAGKTPGVSYGKRRLNANAQRCGAVAEPGIDYCAAHAKLAGFLRCPVHGWVHPLYRHGTIIDASMVLGCPGRTDGQWCRVGWNAQRQLVEQPAPVIVPIGQAGE